MNQKVADRLSLRLLDSAGAGWGYGPTVGPTAEPTALACLALAGHRRSPEKIEAGLRFLAQLQLPSGAVPAAADLPHATWSTSLAVLAWSANAQSDPSAFEENRRRALGWLLDQRGLTFASNPRVYGHNTKLSAWPWIADTHSWVEPTAYAMMALRAVGYSEHSRFREAVDLLLDRAVPGSGWNYGNPKMFGALLRPFPATTGIALTALAGQARNSAVDSAIDYLEEVLTTVRAPSSLAWGVLGLSLWSARPAHADDWLEESAERLLAADPRPAEESLLLMAIKGGSAFRDIIAAREMVSTDA